MRGILPRAEWVAERLARVDHPWPGVPPRPRDVAVGVDGTQASEHAVAWGRLLGEHLHLVHATIHRVPPVMPGGVAGEEAATLDLPERREVFEPAVAAAAGTPTTVHLVADEPGHGVDRIAASVGAPLTVVGHAGKGFVERSVLGSVSEHLAHHARASTLVVRDPPPEGPVVAGVGDDPGSEYAASWAAACATWMGRRLILARAVPSEAGRSDFPGTGRDVEAVDLPWPPKAALTDLLRETSASLLVVGHGRTPSWLGSTAIHLVRSAPTSVLVARPW